MDLYRAGHILPVAGAAVSGGGAVAARDGRIIAVGAEGEVRQALKAGGIPPATIREHDFTDSVLMPGLVNVHTHLELSWLEGEDLPADDYVAWLRRLLELRETRENKVDVAGAARQAIEKMVSRGTVAVGDVSNTLSTVAPLADSVLRGVIFHEIYRIRFFIAPTPHGPHTTSPALLKALAGRAAASREPLSVHVAESGPEVELLQYGTGELAGFYKERDFMDDGWQPPAMSPVAHLDRLGVLSPATLAVHCVQVDRQDLARLQERRCTVVTCPRSNARLGVGRAPVPTILGAGIPVALGTDSLASVHDLDLFAEMATLRSDHPKLSAAAVIRMATLNGAKALGLENDLGSLAPGKLARMVRVPLPAPSADAMETVTTCPQTVEPVVSAS
jgi:cytosine/adenosine deaminase-related metal-dependent hydrolase